jgi:hypothetical protein
MHRPLTTSLSAARAPPLRCPSATGLPQAQHPASYRPWKRQGATERRRKDKERPCTQPIAGPSPFALAPHRPWRRRGANTRPRNGGATRLQIRQFFSAKFFEIGRNELIVEYRLEFGAVEWNLAKLRLVTRRKGIDEPLTKFLEHRFVVSFKTFYGLVEFHEIWLCMDFFTKTLKISHFKRLTIFTESGDALIIRLDLFPDGTNARSQQN